MRHGPDMQGDHERRRAAGRRHRGADRVSRAAQDGKGPFAGVSQRSVCAGRNAGFEHGRVESGLCASEFEIGLAEAIERRESIGAPAIPGARQCRLEFLEAA